MIRWPCHGQALRRRPVASPAVSVLPGQDVASSVCRPARVHVPPIPGQDSHDAALVAGDVLPLWQSQGSVSTAAATTKAPPPCSRIEHLRAGLTHLPSPSSLSKPCCLPSLSWYQVPLTSYAATWDTRSSASMLPPSYEAIEDDRVPVFDWTLSSTPSTANIASQVICAYCQSSYTFPCKTEDDQE
jgi:hypothetical protein